MKTFLLASAILLTMGFTVQAQNVNVPDAAFKSYLLGNSLINTNLDSEIQVAEAAAYTGSINCSFLSISDLTGLEAFINLSALFCSYNLLDTINIDQNVLLETLVIDNNNINSVDLSNAPLLHTIHMFDNPIPAIDLSQNGLLKSIKAYRCGLLNLDISNNPLLEYVICDDNELECLDFSNNPNLILIDGSNNPYLQSVNIANGNSTGITSLDLEMNDVLTCIQVDATFDLNNPPALWNFDAIANLMYDCPACGITYVELTVCDSLVSSNGTAWTTSGEYYDTIPSSNGGDSILYYLLTVNYSTTSEIDVTTCETYIAPSGAILPKTGTYTDVILNSAGCDSTITINLVYNFVDVSVTQNGSSLTANVNGATYQWLDCNNGFASISGADSQTYNSTINGSYAVAITIDGCTDTSSCYDVLITNSVLHTNKQLSAFPNPMHESTTIYLDQYYQNIEMSISNVAGQVIKRQLYNSAQELDVKFDAPVGIYFIKISADKLDVQSISIVKK